MTTIIRGAKHINAAIDSAALSQKELDTAIDNALKSVIVHVLVHNDTTVATRALTMFREGKGRWETARDFIANYATCVYKKAKEGKNGKAGTPAGFVFKKDNGIQIDLSACQTPTEKYERVLGDENVVAMLSASWLDFKPATGGNGNKDKVATIGDKLASLIKSIENGKVSLDDREAEIWDEMLASMKEYHDEKAAASALVNNEAVEEGA